MKEKQKTFLKKGEEVVWQEGSLVCLKDENGKYRFDTTSKKSILRQEKNAWIYQKKFDYISPAENLICIVRINQSARLLNIPSGSYLTNQQIDVLESKGNGKYSFKRKNSQTVEILNVEKFLKVWR